MFLKVDCSIQTNPVFLRYSKGRSKQQALGELIQVWIWVKNHAEDGFVGKFSFEDIELGADVPEGTVSRMEDAGFISKNWMSDWLEWGGSEINEKVRKNPKVYRAKYEDCLQHYSTVRNNAQQCAKVRTEEIRGEEIREEKNREDIIKESIGGMVFNQRLDGKVLDGR